MRKLVVLLAACASTPAKPMRLSRVILYQNGIGYFERAGHVGGDTLKLAFARGELDDVLKTLTVIDRLGASVATVDVPQTKTDAITLGVRMASGRVHDLRVSYAVPTPTWKAAYRVVLDDNPTGLLQGWAMVNNVSQEDWNDVNLTLATGAPMSLSLDLHTPEFAKRPDATGKLVAPTLLGPVGDEKVAAVDSDHDGIADAVDYCPTAAEDKDGLDDEDGCPDVDNDGDRIPDADDKCPNEPETYNGFDDTDGCPDRGRVVVTDTSIEILEQIYFAKDSEAIESRSRPIVEAIAATLAGNPEIAKVEIGGHASSDEGDVWGLSAHRAAAVRDALVARGIAGTRIVIVPYGATQPVGGIDKAVDKGVDKDRRVELAIAERREVPVADRHPQPVVDVATAQRSVHTSSKPAEVAGAVRYVLGEPVTVRRGSSTMVSILNKPITAEDAFLFRPDPNAPGSDRHPFRAVRLANDTGFTLEPGPIAIFARGTFVGDSLIGQLDVGETAWVPYALEGGTQVTATTDAGERPVKIVSLHRGVLTVDDQATRTTHYTVRAGRDAAKQLYIRHAKTDGFLAKDLPPGTIDQGDAYLVPLPLRAATESTLAIEEREPRHRRIHLLDAGATELGLYVSGTHVPAPIAEKLATAIALRKDMGAIEDRLAATRERMSDVAARAEEVRANLHALDKVRGADDLRKKLLASLAEVTSDADALARTLATDNEALAQARHKLQESLRDLEL
jgi:outer membrane protein OmpA-like peptidoglycan-associated protein